MRLGVWSDQECSEQDRGEMRLSHIITCTGIMGYIQDCIFNRHKLYTHIVSLEGRILYHVLYSVGPKGLYSGI